MGTLLKDWLETEGPKLKGILSGVQEATQDPNSRPQGNGVTTFPVPDQSAIPGESFEPPPSGDEALSDLGSQAAPGAETSFGPATPPPGAATPPPGAATPPPGAAPQSTFGAQEQPAQGGEAPVSFRDVISQVPPEKVEAGIKTIEKANNGKTIDQIYYEATGDKGGQMSRQQKGELLMEFGLALMARSGPDGPGFSAAFGEAGGQTLRSYQEKRKENITHDARAIEGVQDYDVKAAQVDKYLRGPSGKYTTPQIKQDAQGNWVTIDPMTSEAKPVIGPDGKPLSGKAGGGAGSLDFEVKKASYEALYCSGMDGEALLSCKRKAHDSAMNSSTESKSLEKVRDQRVKIGLQVMKDLSDADNPTRYTVTGADGSRRSVKWKDVPDAQRQQILTDQVNKTVAILTNGPPQAASTFGGTDAEAGSFDGAEEPAIDLSQEDFDAIPEGKTAELDDGTRVRKENGQLIRVN